MDELKLRSKGSKGGFVLGCNWRSVPPDLRLYHLMFVNLCGFFDGSYHFLKLTVFQISGLKIGKISILMRSWNVRKLMPWTKQRSRRQGEALSSVPSP